jgi:hypothetical protein
VCVCVYVCVCVCVQEEWSPEPMSIQIPCLAQIKPCIKYPMKLCPVPYCQNKCVSHVERMREEERILFPVGNLLVVSLILQISSIFSHIPLEHNKG